ncbi:MAG: hypothetical protein HY593_04350 [Candidatus Omnitrophica bacterium]|nr:hypothetical protein [Candidatus Omnitrophota bacterium]
MNWKRALLTGAALSVVLIGLEFLIHWYLLMDIYVQTAGVWRPQAEMRPLTGYMLLGDILFAFFYAIIYAKGYETSKGSLGQGFRYGILMGLLIAPATSLMWYVVLPIPAILSVYWFLASFAEMLVLGTLAGLIYRD